LPENIDFYSIYTGVAQGVYLVALMVTLVYGVVFLGRKPGYFKTYLLNQSLWLLLPILFLSAGSVLFFLAAVGLNQVASYKLFAGLGFVLFLNITIGIACLPAALSLGKPKVRRPWKAKERASIYTMALVTLGWSFISLPLLSVLFHFKIEIPDNSFVRFISPDRITEYLSFCCFALLGAVVEEIIFRGVIQGSLEKTFMGRWGALVITSIIFALGHAGYITPHGLKEIHTFGLGMLFGLARYYYGIHTAIVLHFMNNLIAVVLEFFIPSSY
jgi:membrane protease YdiL (CAAX protease family)